MGKSTFAFILVFLVLMSAIVLQAQVLPRDLNGEPMQMGSTFSARTVAATADTVYTSVTVPAGTYSVYLLPSAGLQVSADSLYTNPAVNVTLAATTPIEIPVLRKPYFYIRRAAA